MTQRDCAEPVAVDLPVDWVGAPLIPGEWFDITPDESAEILVILGRYLQGAELPTFIESAHAQRMRAMAIEAYPQWLLVECQAQLNSESIVLYNLLFGPNGVVLIDGRSDMLHAFNRLVGVNLAEASAAAEYLRFFCSVVRSELGRFEIIDTARDLTFGPNCSVAQKVAVKKLVKPLKRIISKTGDMLFEATVRYGPSLFHTRFSVPSGGQLEMMDDDPLDFGGQLETELFEGPFRIPVRRSNE